MSKAQPKEEWSLAQGQVQRVRGKMGSPELSSWVRAAFQGTLLLFRVPTHVA